MTTGSTSLLHAFNDKKGENIGLLLVAFLLLAIFLGIWTGYFFAKQRHVSLSTGTASTQSSSGVTYAKGQIIGSSDTSTFHDIAEGVLKAGGIGDEGQYHLVRSGGDSQNVYLTSSSVDLGKLLDKKIKVWGATQKAQKAGWLMDVGRVLIE